MNCLAELLAADSPFMGAFWAGLWQGVFQLAVLGLIAFRVNVAYQRFRERSTARQELIDEIDQFTDSLYKPRKIYQAMIDQSLPLLSKDANPGALEARRTAMAARMLEETVTAEGRFRSLQVKIVPLYGYHVEVFAHYLAIWRYVKEIRKRMATMETLIAQPGQKRTEDTFYRLIDTFRYRITMEKFAKHPPSLTQPPPALLRDMQRRAGELYEEYFGSGA